MRGRASSPGPLPCSRTDPPCWLTMRVMAGLRGGSVPLLVGVDYGGLRALSGTGVA
jgi:hypothetical protein